MIVKTTSMYALSEVNPRLERSGLGLPQASWSISTAIHKRKRTFRVSSSYFVLQGNQKIKNENGKGKPEKYVDPDNQKFYALCHAY